MNRGQLKCCGSPSFLKENFGFGYRLSIRKNDQFDLSVFLDFLQQHDNYVIETNVANELCIGFSKQKVDAVVAILRTIEENKDQLGVETYGISTPTVEEVFLK